MAATQGVAAFNTKIYVYITSAWTIIEEPKDIDGPGGDNTYVDFTHQQSPAGYREEKPSMKDPGTVTFPCNFVHNATAQQYLINAAVANPVTQEWFKVVGPDNSEFRFHAYPSFRMNYAMNGALEVRFTLRVSGQIETLLPSTSPSASASAS